MNALRRKLSVLVPCHEHDERIAIYRSERAVGLRLAVDRAVGVRATIDRLVEFPAPKPVDLSPFRIDAVEMRLQIHRCMTERRLRRARPIVFMTRAAYGLCRQDRKRCPPVVDVRAAIPGCQNLTGLP